MRSERVIVLLKQFLGDGVMTEPLLSALSDNFSHVDVLAIPSVRQVLEHLDGKVSFVHVEPMRSLRDTMEQSRKIRRKGYDVAILVNRSFRSALLARLSKIPVRIGHGTEGRSVLLTKSVPYRAEDFEAKSYADLGTAAGIEVMRIEPQLRVTEEERAQGSDLAPGASVAIQAGARHDYKRVSVEHLAVVAQELQRRGHEIVLLGGAEERAFGETLCDALPRRPANLIGETSIRQTLGVLSNMQLALGSDTGVMHLAAGLGIPTVTAFGPTAAIKWGHHYAPHTVLQAPGGDLSCLDPRSLVDAALRALDE